MKKRKLSHPLSADQFEMKNVALTQNNYDSATFLKEAVYIQFAVTKQ